MAVSEDFTLANPSEWLPVAGLAKTRSKIDLACHLVRDAEARFGNSLDVTPCRLIEADLLQDPLNKPEQAAWLMETLLEGQGGKAYR